LSFPRWRGRDVISILDFTREELDRLFNEALEVERDPSRYSSTLEGRIVALAFFEPSTRTLLSFDTAVKRLGGQTIGFASQEALSISKGENLADTIRMLDVYADCIVIRHPCEGSSKFAAEIARSPVINAGDGSQHHPTQAMIDLYTIWRRFGSFSNLTIGVIGDLRYGRAATSFIFGLTIYRPRKLYLISPQMLRVREEVLDVLKKSGVKFEEAESLEEVASELDVLYVTRIQKERFPDPSEYEAVKGSYRIDSKVIRSLKEHAIIMHPLPRVDEISFEVDSSRHAFYFVQASYGIPVRMALLKLVLVGEAGLE